MDTFYKNPFLRLLFVLLIAVCSASSVFSQSAANYTFSTVATGSLTDMSSGTTNLLATGTYRDDDASAVTNIGFTFYFMGTAYTQFSINSNAQMRLGSTVIGGAQQSPAAGVPLIAALSGDNAIRATGKAHFRVDGTAPNRILIVEWVDLRVPLGSAVETGTYCQIQTVLYESTGKIEFIYGRMYNMSTSTVTRSIFFSSATTAGTIGQVTNIITTMDYNTTATSLTNTTFALSADMTNLNSTADGSRRVFSFTPQSPSPAAPTTLTFSGISGTGLTVNWVDNSTTETYFQVSRATAPGGPFTIVGTVNSTTTAGTGTGYNLAQTGLAWNTSYYYKISAVNEGSAPSSDLTGNQATSSGTIFGVKTIGSSGDYSSLTEAFADITSNGVGGPVQLEFIADYNPASETYPIVISFVTNSDNAITIRPQSGVTGINITSANTTATVSLNGCQYITIDGRQGGEGTSRDLTITNSSTGAAVLFINDAISNTITYTNLVGTANTSASSGVVFFSTTTATLGNDDNTVSYCDINALGSSTGIQSLGTSAKTNSGNQILNNNIRDYYISSSSSTSTYGVRIQSNSTNWTISNNNFYQTNSRSYSTTSAIHYIISIGTGTSSDGGYVISGNYLGGSAAGAAGTYNMTSGQQRLFAMDLSVGTVSPTSIQGNTITAIACTTAFATTSSSGILGINLSGGSFNVGTITGNVIGSGTATGAINLHITGTAGPLFVGINCATTSGTTNIQNNTIGGMLATTTTSTAYLSLYPISLSGSVHTVNISGNTIGSTSTANSVYNNTGGTSTSTYQTRGMNITSTGILTVSNNTIANISASGTGTGTTLAGIYMVATPSSTGWTVTGNTVRNLTNGSSSTTFGSATQALSGLVFSGSQLHTISGNTIHSLSNTNTTAANLSIVGIYFSGSTSLQSVIEKNFVHSIKMSTTYKYARVTGIMITGGLHMLRNNMVRLGVDESGNAITTAYNFNGIWKTVATVGNYFHNSIYIGGTGVGTDPVKTFCFRKHGTSGADSLLNNIFWNARSNASSGGRHYAIGVNQSSGLISNYNVFYANGTDGTLATRDTGSTTNYNTLTDLQSGFGGTDANSIVGGPNFATPNGTSSTVNLHIANPTPVEATGLALTNVTDDYDGQTRSGLTPTDIGADAGDFTPADVSAPNISFTALGTTSSTGNRTLTGTITDATGVPTSGALVPRVYYKKNSGSWYSGAGTLASGSATNGTWNFEINSTTMGGVIAGDIISYFIVAQDAAPAANLVSNPTGASGTDVNTLSAYPSSPSQYIISGALAGGNYLIGGTGATPSPGCTYVDLSEAFADINSVVLSINVTAGGSAYTSAPTVVITGSGSGAAATATITGDAVTSITVTSRGTGYLTAPTISFTGGGGTGATATATVSANKEITGAVSFILSSSYSAAEENLFPVTLNNVSGSSATNTITIKPNTDVNATITGSSTTGIIRLNNVNYVTIDGSNNGSSSRNLTISNSSTGSNTAAVWLSSAGTGSGSSNNTIKNCNINAGVDQSTATTYTVGIYSGGSTVSVTTGGADNDNNTYQNNYITKVRAGINDVGLSSTNPNSGVVITQNIIGPDAGFGANQIGATGIMIMNQDGIQITQNKIRYVGGPYSLTSGGADRTGITMANTTASTGAAVTGTVMVRNANISRNMLHDVWDERTFSASGIVLAGADGTNSTNNIVSNNVIFRIRGNGTSSDQTHGITIVGGKDDKVVYNSIYLSGDVDSSSASTSTSSQFGIAVTNANPVNLTIKNNAVFNRLYSSKSATTLKYAAISIPASFNWGTGGSNYNGLYRLADSARQHTGNVGAALAGGTFYQALTDWQTAVTQDANSVGGDPLFRDYDNLQPFTGSPLLAAGTPVSGITVDYTGAARNGTTPSIGAYEGGFTPPAVDWANLQWPPTASYNEGAGSVTVYARVYEPDVTPGAGQGAGIQCWIGYSSSNTNPNSQSGWTWVAATYNTDNGNNDEYQATIGANLAAGTYYYASRFLLTDGVYQYGGYSGGGGNFWDGTTYISGVLTVNDNSITWANLQFPSSATIQETGSADIYARVYVAGVTTQGSPSANIQCWIGWNATNTDPSTWTNWTAATFTAHQGNNDEYKASIGSGLAAGTYYYASRFKFMNDNYVYGGYSSGGGNYWNGTEYVSGTLTVNELSLTPPFLQDFSGTFPPTRWNRYSGLLAAPSTLTPVSTTWVQDDFRNVTSPVNKSAKINIYGTTQARHWLTTPTINLSSGTDYQLLFEHALTAYDGSGAAGTTGTDDKFAVVISTDNGTTWTSANNLKLWDNAGSPNIYNNIANAGETVTIPLTGYSGAVKIAFYGESTVSNADNDMFVDNVRVRAVPAATNAQTITSGSTDPVQFTGTGTTVQFTVGNGTALELTVDKIVSNPGGTVPSGVVNIAPQYWSITVTSGTVSGTYSITLDITGVPGVNNPSTVRLIKRDNASGVWTNFGTPSSINGNLLTWTGLTSFSEFGLGGDNDNPLPVEIVSFSAKAKQRDVVLNWSTATEVNSYQFEVERVLEKRDNSSSPLAWAKVGAVQASGNSNSPKEYSFADKKLNSGNYIYRLKAVDNDGTFSYSKEVSVSIEVPRDFSLSQNYPNPFNPSTKIDYQLPQNATVTMELFSITGERVALLINEEQDAGYHTYLLNTNSLSRELSTGVYIYRLAARGLESDAKFMNVKKLMIIK